MYASHFSRLHLMPAQGTRQDGAHGDASGSPHFPRLAEQCCDADEVGAWLEQDNLNSIAHQALVTEGTTTPE